MKKEVKKSKGKKKVKKETTGHKYSDDCACDECALEFRRVLLANLKD